MESLWDKADRYRRLALRADRGQEARDRKAREHDLLVECVTITVTEAIMRRHIDTSTGATAVGRLGDADHAGSARKG